MSEEKKPKKPEEKVERPKMVSPKTSTFHDKGIDNKGGNENGKANK